MTPPAPRMRELTRRAVKQELAETAMQLFLVQGFEATTVDDVAAAAGVSRSSFFRYFPTKEDVMLEALGEAHLGIAASLRNRPRAEPAWTSLRRSLDDMVSETEARHEKARPLIRMLFETPVLHRALTYRSAGWAELVADELTDWVADLDDDPLAGVRVAALATCALSCLQTAQREWATTDRDVPFSVVLDAAMGAVSPFE